MGSLLYASLTFIPLEAFQEIRKEVEEEKS